MKMLSVKELAILDMELHGKKLILSEFLGAFILGMIFGTWIIIHSNYSFAGNIIGIVIIGIALNYLPLVFYGVGFIKGSYAPMSKEDKNEAMKRGAQSLLLGIPFLILLVSIFQGMNNFPTSKG